VAMFSVVRSSRLFLSLFSNPFNLFLDLTLITNVMMLRPVRGVPKISVPDSFDGLGIRKDWTVPSRNNNNNKSIKQSLLQVRHTMIGSGKCHVDLWNSHEFLFF